MAAVAENRTTVPVCDEAEAALIGSLLFAPNLIERVRDIVSADDFYSAVHHMIFEAMCLCSDAGKTPSPVTLRPYMDMSDAIAGTVPHGNVSAYLVELVTHGAAGLVGAIELAEQVREVAQRRTLIAAMQEMIARAVNPAAEDPIAAIMEDADCSLTAILNRELSESAGIKQVSAAQAFEEMAAEFDTVGTSGVTCGDIACLDETMGPIRPHHLAILAGRPGMGKTAVALSYAIGAAQKGHGVLFVSLEMSRIELMQRATSALIFDGHRGVPYEMIRDGRLGINDKRRVFDAGRAFRDLPLYIVDAAALTIGRLNSVIRRWKRRLAARGQSLDLVIVDYLQLLHPDRPQRSAYEAVSEVSRSLKGIAKMHDVGVMALAQLSRAVEQRADKRPQLSDLRDSGQIEQDADAVCFLYREEYYVRQAMTDPTSEAYAKLQEALERCFKQIDFIVAKRRNGPDGTSKGEFHGAFQAVRG